ncbi:hypothetical protein BpHYR1_010638 [Brachionus plicatilis]|uniref:Uncharacterized protein n=1 Tax=Brachionus plicatilis TaxID=10195 RepID=A0A3M7QHC4_BRAPC|nr:hypothetical protein BpHYR1_010638 [Brachionus plicatilis]
MKKINNSEINCILCDFQFHSNYLRDLFDNKANKKIKDLDDFEWQRCFRVYVLDENGKKNLIIKN